MRTPLDYIIQQLPEKAIVIETIALELALSPLVRVLSSLPPKISVSFLKTTIYVYYCTAH